MSASESTDVQAPKGHERFETNIFAMVVATLIVISFGGLDFIHAGTSRPLCHPHA